MPRVKIHLSKCLVCGNDSVTTIIIGNAPHYSCRICGAELHFPVIPKTFGANFAEQDLNTTVDNIRTALEETEVN